MRRPTGRDVVSGLVTGLFSIPEGMAYTLAKFGDWFAHLGLWDTASALIAVGTIAVSALARLVRPLRKLATLVALGVMTVVVEVAHRAVELVCDTAAVTRSFPAPVCRTGRPRRS